MKARAGLSVKWIVMIFTIASLGCSSTKTKDQDPKAVAAQKLYEESVRHLGDEKYQPALEGFDEFLAASPTNSFTQAALFNRAQALEGLGRWPEANEQYRAVVKNTAHAPRLRALSLYRQSFCLEAMGDVSQTVAVLIDTKNRARDLPQEIAAAELPARLASAYARAGNIDQAMFYYGKAEAGISRLRNAGAGKGVPDWLPKTLFQMGQMSSRQIAWDNFDEALRPLEKTQIYLLQAAEFGMAPWSEKASGELIRIYESILPVFANKPPAPSDKDPVEFAREVQTRRWQMAERALDSLRDLKAARAPQETGGSQNTEPVFDQLSTVERGLAAVLDEAPAGSELTPEGKARKERVRGKVVSPDDELEREYTKGKATALPAKVKSQEKTPEKAAGDPNL